MIKKIFSVCRQMFFFTLIQIFKNGSKLPRMIELACDEVTSTTGHLHGPK